MGARFGAGKEESKSPAARGGSDDLRRREKGIADRCPRRESEEKREQMLSEGKRGGRNMGTTNLRKYWGHNSEKKDFSSRGRGTQGSLLEKSRRRSGALAHKSFHREEGELTIGRGMERKKGVSFWGDTFGASSELPGFWWGGWGGWLGCGGGGGGGFFCWGGGGGGGGGGVLFS